MKIAYDIQPSIFSEGTLVATINGPSAGICGIFFNVPDCAAAEKLLTSEFPAYAKARFDYQSVRAMNYTDKFIASLNQNTDLKDISLNIISGTAFQRKVWNALLQIPKGETRTYSEVATMAGNSKAIRATASAIASNPISILIPCHRAIPKSGGIGKYRWGSEMKAGLLGREKKIIDIKEEGDLSFWTKVQNLPPMNVNIFNKILDQIIKENQ